MASQGGAGQKFLIQHSAGSGKTHSIAWAAHFLAAQMSAHANVAGITFVAFTATPKPKTLELFGRRPNPDLPASDSNIPGPFHVYSMRQAIEEKFILDVLRGYTPYKLAFKLASGGQEWDEKEVDLKRGRAHRAGGSGLY